MLLLALLSFLSSAIAAAVGRRECANGPTTRHCWGQYDINTNFYDVVPDTGVTREFWLSAQNLTLAPDGYEREVLAFNGQIPGPLIEADWGDTIVVHVTNELENNGTSIHWHGIRQLNNNENDGVPGVTQCPIPPGETYTYTWRATQYGHSWYHSHFSLQYGNGLFGPILIHGPSSANWDVDLGVLPLQDWAHESVFTLWAGITQYGAPPPLPNGLINGTNTFDCRGSSDPACLGTGKRYENSFVQGKKYLIRLVNTAVDGYFRFSIDNHKLTVAATDLVPIQPYETDNVLLGSGQRYDIIVEADQPIGNYWLRATYQTACRNNSNANNILGIIRYEGSDPVAVPTTHMKDFPEECQDEPLDKLVPYMALNAGQGVEKSLDLSNNKIDNIFHWTMNGSAFYIDWSEPALLMLESNDTVYPADYGVYELDAANEWIYWIIRDESTFATSHPIHLHGHDFNILAQGEGELDLTTITLNTDNPPRRDVATLPGGGYLVIAFQTDNPGFWLMHCHIAWHSSQGFAVQFAERRSEILATVSDQSAIQEQCDLWDGYFDTEPYEQDDAGV
ncbi:hypothetical protein ASPZODRAFT_57033 [Penicilliopsis zonata CBS 506.65]|uniref:Laccase n=1 Tax=Penicilliopsis zonata CBS 506.65 TaxID=1073090 RepID=A0A1L9SX25_9EURO|nr:hypothetical protein ASPZODRAFT_57033 [Penicilliopsis zonata CBS 506.65]OJJ51730.1 hypothetical protein ASPZODRAFT_57033 [Penicilliopsis zonata CBS 506.65]